MTYKEIIQALRICATHKDKGCGLCPQRKYVRCKERLADEAITMIERLTAENVALREGASLGKVKRSQKQAYEKQIESLQALANRQLSEIKKLQKDLCWKDLEVDDTEWKQERAEAERDALREKKRWISVTEKTPEYDMPQLALNADGEALIANYAYGEWFDTWGQDVEVTHWMPLPEAPEEGDKA